MCLRHRKVCRLAIAPFVALVLYLHAPTAFGVTAPGITDGELVYCLSPNGVLAIVEAAKALGLVDGTSHGAVVVVKQQSLSVDQWHVQYQPEFERTCIAATGARQLANPTVTVNQVERSTSTNHGWYLLVLPTVTGAALTWFVTVWRDRTARGIERATELRESADLFAEETGEYLDAWKGDGGRPPKSGVMAARAALRVRLRSTSALHPKWDKPAVVLLKIREEEFGPQLFEGWAGDSKVVRTTRADILHVGLEDLVVSVDLIAGALSRPGFPSGMRRFW